MRENALELHGVCKKYGGFALRNVGFTLPRGTVMGLIGENGAGKTTTIKAVLDLIRPDSGEITVLGEHGSNPSVREKIGVVLEDGGFPSAMSAVQVSTLLGRAYKNWNAEQFASYIGGELQPGEALPSMRLLAKELRISVITTKRAYEELEREGLITSQTGRGSFVAPVSSERLREAQLRTAEQHLTDAVQAARLAGLSADEFAELARTLFEEEGL